MNSRILKAKENESFFKKIKDFDNYIDWKITVVFYTSLHYLDAIAIKAGIIGSHGFKNHEHREKLTAQLPIFEFYFKNKRYSKTARYECLFNNQMYEQVAKINFTDSQSNLKIIKKHATSIGITI